MCLKYIGERECKNEGVAYKVLRRINYDAYSTPYLNWTAIPDTWLLHAEPEAKCFNGACCCYASRAKYIQACNDNIIYTKKEFTTYNHGFHLCKTYCYATTVRANFTKQAAESSILNGPAAANLYAIRSVYYKDVIAEDDTQIVVKQMYICDKTKHPDESLIKASDGVRETVND